MRYELQGYGVVNFVDSTGNNNKHIMYGPLEFGFGKSAITLKEASLCGEPCPNAGETYMIDKPLSGRSAKAFYHALRLTASGEPICEKCVRELIRIES